MRSHGGAVRRKEATRDYPLRLKATLHRAEKIRIGQAAAELVRPNETIILDSGTTTAEIAVHLRERRVHPCNSNHQCNECLAGTELTLREYQ